MEKKRILVVTDTFPWGHRSIAKAIFNFLKGKEKEEQWEIRYAAVKVPMSIFNDIYTFVYRFFPLSNKLVLKLMENDFMRKVATELTEYSVPELEKIVEKYKPDLVISAYFFHSHALVKMRQKKRQNFKLWTVVADPWTVNLISFVKGADLHLVYDDVLEKAAMENGIKKSRIFKTGWWVRQEMYDEKTQNSKFKIQKRKEMGFDDNRPIIFVGGGSLGTNSLVKLLPVLMVIKTKVGLIFNTGTDKLAFNMVEEYVKLFKRLGLDKTVEIRNIGWIEDMAGVLSICDIVFGKAGPNFLFDVVAVGKPFVAITHIGGQEDGNLEIIRKKKLGWIREKGNQPAEFLVEYLKNPDKYNNKFRSTIDEEAKRNRESLPKLLGRIKTVLKEKTPPKTLLQ